MNKAAKDCTGEELTYWLEEFIQDSEVLLQVSEVEKDTEFLEEIKRRLISQKS